MKNVIFDKKIKTMILMSKLKKKKKILVLVVQMTYFGVEGMSALEFFFFFHLLPRSHICSLAVARTNGRVMQTQTSPLSCLNT